MRTCILCHYEIDPDDVEMLVFDDRCLCVGCLHREAGSTKPMPHALQREIMAIAGAMLPDEPKTFRNNPYGYGPVS